MGEEYTTIALSLAMIVFPTFVIIPSIYGYIRQSLRPMNAVLTVFPFWIAAFSLILGVTFASIRLLGVCTAQGLALFILMSICAVAVLIFLWVLPNFLFELALLAEYERAKSGDVSNPVASESQAQPVDNEAES